MHRWCGDEPGSAQSDLAVGRESGEAHEGAGLPAGRGPAHGDQRS